MLLLLLQIYWGIYLGFFSHLLVFFVCVNFTFFVSFALVLGFTIAVLFLLAIHLLVIYTCWYFTLVLEFHLLVLHLKVIHLLIVFYTSCCFVLLGQQVVAEVRRAMADVGVLHGDCQGRALP